jgi:hypothetical protein
MAMHFASSSAPGVLSRALLSGPLLFAAERPVLPRYGPSPIAHWDDEPLDRFGSNEVDITDSLPRLLVQDLL